MPKNVLIFSDLHLQKQSLDECKLILDEIIELCKKYKITTIIDAGDTFDVVKPTSEELDIFSAFITALDAEFICLAADSHESETKSISVINHFGILNSNVKVVKEYIEGNELYVGHFIVSQSSKNYGGTVDSSTLKKYKHVILGHGHIPDDMGNIHQLGSVRYVDFGDDGDIPKRVSIIKDGNLEFVTLKSPYPLINIELSGKVARSIASVEPIRRGRPKKVQVSPSETQNLPLKQGISSVLANLDALDPKTKVRVIFKDFEGWLAFRPHYQRYKEKFILFGDKKDFIISATSSEKLNDKKIDLKDSLAKYLKDISCPQSISDILLSEIK